MEKQLKKLSDTTPEELAKEFFFAELEEKYGEVLNTTEATAKYEFKSFLAPFVLVERKSDEVEGLLQFSDYPRYYFDFTEK